MNGQAVQGILQGISGGLQSILGAAMANSAGEALKTGVKNAKENYNNEYQQGISRLNPYYTHGTQDYQTLGSMVRNGEFDMNNWDYKQDPGYQFRLQQGERAIQANMAGSGMGLSGATQKALLKYGQNFASNEYGNSYSRASNNMANQYNMRSNLAGYGYNTANALAGMNMQAGQQLGDYSIQYGNARAGRTMGVNNAIMHGMDNVIGASANAQQNNGIGTGGMSGGAMNNGNGYSGYGYNYNTQAPYIPYQQQGNDTYGWRQA